MKNSPAFDRLLKRLDLDALDADLFLGDPGGGKGRLFGGMVAAQSVVAAGRTVPPDRPLHSLHAYFLRPGRHDVPLRFVVDRIRDGRSFTTRRVKAHQAGEAIFNLAASFAVVEEGLEHQEPMPEAPPPDGLPTRDELLEAQVTSATQNKTMAEIPVEVRMCDPLETDGTGPPRQRNWIRLPGTLPDDPLIHTAMLVYASDRTMISASLRPHDVDWDTVMAASLDHAVWIHSPVKVEGWMLYVTDSPIARSARGLNLGALYKPDGTRIASVAQEGLIRVKK